MSTTATGPSPILQSFLLDRVGDTSFRAPSVPDERRPVVFGGQIMGQMIMAASAYDPTKGVKSLNVIFARAGTVKLPVEMELDPVHSGRALGSMTATVFQGERLLSRGLLLLDVGEPDVIRHQIPDIPTGGPGETPPVASTDHPGVEVRLVDAVDLMTTAATGPAEVNVWVRFLDLTADAGAAWHQAALSWYTDPFLIAAAMRPHEGIGQEQAHETLSTGVISQTLTFHDPFRADQWLLIANRSLHAGAGRTYGEGHVFTEKGELVASFVQTNMIRYFRDETPGATGKAAGAM
jgi:acyl-CoA thioesterase II